MRHATCPRTYSRLPTFPPHADALIPLRDAAFSPYLRKSTDLSYGVVKSWKHSVMSEARSSWTCAQHRGSRPCRGASVPLVLRCRSRPTPLVPWDLPWQGHRGLFVAIVEPFQEFAHSAVGIGQAKVLLDPGDCLGGATNVSIQPGRKLLLAWINFFKRRTCSIITFLMA